MAPDLTTLPTEIIESICRTLNREDLGRFRSISRGLNEKTFHYFSSACFKRHSIDLSADSLNRLKHISEHERIRYCVQHLSICHERSVVPSDPSWNIVPAFGQGNTWIRHPSGCLDMYGPVVSSLREILANGLVNCESFYVCHQWQHSEEAAPFEVGGPDAIGLLLEFIAAVDLNIKRFSFSLSEYAHSKVNLDTLQLPLQTPKFKQGWCHLQDLEIYSSLPMTVVPWTSDLVVLATNLRRLVIRCGSCSDKTTINSLLDRLSHATKLPSLHEFTLLSVSIDAEILCRFLHHFSHCLRKLELSLLNIYNGSWASVLKILGTQLHGLKRMSVIRVSEHPSRPAYFSSLIENPVVPETGSHSFTLLQHLERDGSRKCKVYGIDYQGPRMDLALEKLANSVEFHERPPLPSNPAPREVDGLDTVQQRYFVIHEHVTLSWEVEVIKPGDFISIVHKEGNGWWLAANGNRRTWVPSAYLEELEEPASPSN